MMKTLKTDETEKEVLISPVANILAFIGFTLLLFSNADVDAKIIWYILIIYTMLIYSMQILINMKNTKVVCGETKEDRPRFR